MEDKKTSSNPFSIENLAATIDKIAEAVNQIDDEDPPLKTLREIEKDRKKRNLKVVKGGQP